MATTPLVSGSIQWTGLASGTDFASMVDSLVAIEERVITRQETWKSQWEEKLTAINTLDTRLVSLKQACTTYDDISELLARKATSSDEKVVSIVNTSTAPTGVYSVEVADEVCAKMASRSFKDGAGIGINHLVDKDGHALDADGNLIFDETNKVGEDENGYPIDADGNILYTENPDDYYYPPLTISMGGKSLSLEYGVDFTADTTMAELAETINAKTQAEDYNGPAIRADIISDKTRKEGDETVSYSRLVITGLEAGSANIITISDPSNLGMDETYIDQPVTSSLVGSNIKPVIADDAKYTGVVNKTITVVCTNIGESGVFGSDDLVFSWADNQGNSGSFTVKADDWDFANNCLKEDVELEQGVKINLKGADSGSTRMILNEAFTIDCQAPVLQQAADSGLAQTDKWVHVGFPDLTSPVTKGGSSKFVFSYGGEECSVTVGDGAGLSALVEAINKSSDNPGVVASVINDGMGTATSYKLVLTGAHSGAENVISISEETNLTLLDCSPENFEHARAASNSMCRIDGYPSDGESWIQRSTNEVSDVLDGIVLNLEGEGESQVIIANNVTEMVNRIKDIVSAVNSARTYIKEQTKWGSGTFTSEWDESTQSFVRTYKGGEASGVMIGNYGFQIAQSTIDDLMTSPIITMEDYVKAIDPEGETVSKYPKKKEDETVEGQSWESVYQKYLDDNGLIYTKLSEIGIESNTEGDNGDGVYVVDEAALTEALQKNPDAVLKLFTFTPDDISKVQPYEDEQPRPRLGGFAVMMGYAMSDLTRENDVIDSQTGDVIQPAKGIMKVLAANYTNIISGIDEKIAREETRIAMVRSRLEEKYARLETTLAELQAQSSSLESQLSQLSGSSNE